MVSKLWDRWFGKRKWSDKNKRFDQSKPQTFVNPDFYLIEDREQSVVAEAFRALCAAIRDVEKKGSSQAILFTSANSGPGGTVVAINAAALLAYAGNKVILVDCDLRTPVVHEFFQLRNVGLTNFVKDEVAQEEILQASLVPNLQVVTSGPLALEPVPILSNSKVRTLLQYLRRQADYVFLTSSSLLIKAESIVSDACVLASKVDGVVLVIDSRKVRPKDIRKVEQLLVGAKGHLIGTVLNDVIPN